MLVTPVDGGNVGVRVEVLEKSHVAVRAELSAHPEELHGHAARLPGCQEHSRDTSITRPFREVNLLAPPLGLLPDVAAGAAAADQARLHCGVLTDHDSDFVVGIGRTGRSR